MQPLENLTVKAAALQRSSPQVWRDFMDAFAAYSEAQRIKLVQSPLPDLPVNQGRCQGLQTLFDIFTKAPESADKIAKARS